MKHSQSYYLFSKPKIRDQKRTLNRKRKSCQFTRPEKGISCRNIYRETRRDTDTHRDTNRHTHKQTDRKRERDRQTETDGQAETDRERE